MRNNFILSSRLHRSSIFYFWTGFIFLKPTTIPENLAFSLLPIIMILAKKTSKSWFKILLIIPGEVDFRPEVKDNEDKFHGKNLLSM